MKKILEYLIQNIQTYAFFILGHMVNNQPEHIGVAYKVKIQFLINNRPGSCWHRP